MDGLWPNEKDCLSLNTNGFVSVTRCAPEIFRLICSCKSTNLSSLVKKKEENNSDLCPGKMSCEKNPLANLIQFVALYDIIQLNEKSFYLPVGLFSDLFFWLNCISINYKLFATDTKCERKPTKKNNETNCRKFRIHNYPKSLHWKIRRLKWLTASCCLLVVFALLLMYVIEWLKDN